MTEKFARTAEQPPTGQRLLFDDRETGFGIRLTKGSRSWIVQISDNRRTKRATLGKVGDMPMVEARKKAVALKLAGLKPTDTSGRPKTVADLWERMKAEDAHRLRERTKTLYNGYWTHHIEPALGRKKLAGIEPADISAMLAGIPGNANANRVHELTRRLLGYAVAHRWLADNPSLGWKRRHEAARESYLEAAAMAALFAALPVNEVGDALRFAALTGARIGEVLSMRHTDLRDNGSVWSKPASSTKQKRQHIVPLSAEAILVAVRQVKSGPFVFSREDGSPIKNARRTWLWALKRARLSGVRIHDLRHSLASAMIQLRRQPCAGRGGARSQYARNDAEICAHCEPDASRRAR